MKRPLVTSAAAASYETYGNQQNLYDNSHVTHSDNDLEVSDTYAASSSPRPAYTAAPTRSASTINTKPTKKGGLYLPRPTSGAQVFSPEIPTHMAGSFETISEGSTRPTAAGLHSIILNSQKPSFVHSDISHPGADSVLIENPYLKPSTESYVQTTQNKGTYAKPQFRPKPTSNKFATDKYVLVQTISHDKHDAPTKPQGTMSENDIESIESIILMLNDTKTGPQYNTESRPQTTYGYDYTSDSFINTNKYGGSQSATTKFPTSTYVFSSTKRPIQTTSNNVYDSSTPSYSTSSAGAVAYGTSSIGTASGTLLVKGPTLSFNPPSSARPPSTSYVFSTTTPKRPTTTGGVSGYNKLSSTTTTSKKPLKIKKPNQKTTQRPISTSYVTGSTTARPYTTASKRPSIISSYSPNPSAQPSPSTYAPLLNSIQSSTPAPTVIVLGPYGILGTEAPSPTVHITPKPNVNLVTSSSMWTNRPSINNKYTPVKLPSYTPVITSHPEYSSRPEYNIRPDYTDNPLVYTSLSTIGSTPGYGGEQHVVSNDFDDPGYYGISSTLRPVAPPIIQQTITSSSIYTVVDDNASPPYPNYGGYGNIEESLEHSTLNGEYYTSPNDVNNFPPVRNPNLNMSSTFNGGPIEDYDISTPEFVEDELLNDKMGLLVSKIVESLQGSFDNLADVVYDNKSSIGGSSTVGSSSARPTTIKRPGSSSTGTKKPPQRATTKRPPSARPGTTLAARPTTKPTKPNRRTTKRPATTVFINTTKRPVNRVIYIREIYK